MSHVAQVVHHDVDDGSVAFHLAARKQHGGVTRRLAESVERLGSHDQVRLPRFILDRHKHHAICRAGTLTDQHDSRNRDAPAVGPTALILQLGARRGVQTLQLIAGIKHTEVRSPNTLEALSSLTEVGILTTEQREQFQQSYCFLRMVENRLRIVHDRPLNALPTRQSELDKLARRLDYVDQDGTPAAEQFLDDFQRHTKQTRALFDELLDVSAFTVAQI